MARRLRLYAKALTSEGIRFDVASEGQKRVSRQGHRSDMAQGNVQNGTQGQVQGGSLGQTHSGSQEWRTLFEGHRVWHWSEASKPGLIGKLQSRFFGWTERFRLYGAIWRDREASVVMSAGYRWPQMLMFALICQLRGKVYVIELNELPHSIIASRLQTEWGNRLQRWITVKIAFPRIDGFLAISQNLKELAKQTASSMAHIVTIPILTDDPHVNSDKGLAPLQSNGHKEAQMPIHQPEKEKSEGEGLKEDVPVIFHAGTLTIEKDGIVTVFEAVGKVIRDHGMAVRFHLSNFTTLPWIKAEILRVIEAYGMEEYVTFFNHLSKEELDREFRGCSLVVINKPDNERNRYNFSTKLGECMSYGLPVITTATGEAGRFLKDCENCLVIRDSGSAEEIAGHIRTLLTDGGVAATVRKGALKTVAEYFDYGNHRVALADFFRGVAGVAGHPVEHQEQAGYL